MNKVLALVLAFAATGSAWAGRDGDPRVLTCNAGKNDPRGPRFGYSLYVYASGTAFFSVINHHSGGDDVTERFFPVSYRASRPYKGHAGAYPAQLTDSRGRFVAKVVRTVNLKSGARKYVFLVDAQVSQAEGIGASVDVRQARIECFAANPKAVEQL